MKIENMVGLRYPQFLIWLISSDSSYPWSIKKKNGTLVFRIYVNQFSCYAKNCYSEPTNS